MLVPRFTIRWIVGLTATMGILFAVVRQAFLNAHWAIAITTVLVLVSAIALLFGATFLMAYALARVTRTLAPPKPPENPFIVEGQYPPQEVPRNPYTSDQP